MRVALVGMPWAQPNAPCAALGVLAAYVRREADGIDLVCHSEHLTVAQRIGSKLYRVIGERRAIAELLYLSHLYPERRDRVCRYCSELLAKQLGEKASSALRPGCGSWSELFESVRDELAGHLLNLARRLAESFDVICLTTSLAQTFSSLMLSAAVKRLSSRVVIVLGGAALDGGAGPSILSEYPFIDYVVQGEGEKPLVSLLERLRDGRPIPSTPGLIGRTIDMSPDAVRPEIEDIDSLPIPDYDEYAALGERSRMLWYVPIEGSRGCWWDRSAGTGNPKDRCHFCNYSTTRYRAKSAARLAAEMEALADRYRNLRFGFCDRAMRSRELMELAERILAGRREYNFFAAMRSNIRPRELLALKKAGLVFCECGIEGFSSSYLRRLNKGTSVILNLQALKTCHELGLRNSTTLITNFPGSTQEEVAETARNIQRHAISYSPAARLSPFQLAAGSAVDRFRHDYGIAHVEKHEFYRAGLPEDAFARLELNELEWRGEGRRADWSEVESARNSWRDLLSRIADDARLPFHHPLYYQDGGTFMEIFDRRHGYRSITLIEPWRSIYLFCMEIRSRESIDGRFAEAGAEEVTRALRALVAESLMFEEDGQYLSLAVASTPEIAERRISAAFEDRTNHGATE
ncbi:MAG: RiPP maturation radical SAM C-methyltransferase [Acidobacteriota bacterium]